MIRTVDHNLNKRGFTLSEVLIVAAIVLILIGVGIPVFATVYRRFQDKHIKDLELAAKEAAVAAFYSGYDSKSNKADITITGVCTFLYDANNNAVYVLNDKAGVQDFINNGYARGIDMYGVKITDTNDYSNKVILVTFDGRYFKYGGVYLNAPNWSKGTLEEPLLTLEWNKAGTDTTNTLLKQVVDYD